MGDCYPFNSLGNFPEAAGKIKEAWAGFEPANEGFAGPSLSHLGTTPRSEI